MILIRPLLRANAARASNVHVVVFFIILVANIGGALTPLGDPPLFVGFLHGVDFFWTAQHLWLQTADRVGLRARALLRGRPLVCAPRRLPKPSSKKPTPIRIQGTHQSRC